MKTSTCKCGAKMVWGLVVTPDGIKSVPLDPKAPVYEVDQEASTETKVVVTRNRNAMVSHFATCPNASEFSGGKP